jgi:ubiquinone/menaquinone biosynthesis C-methylase UbiE
MVTASSTNPLGSAEPWDWVAESYVEIAMPLLAQFAEVAIEKAQLKPTQRALDVATGPGTLACRIAKSVGRVCALDFSEEMVARCRARLQNLEIENVAVTQGDGQALPYADASFDVGFSMFGLMFFPDRMRGFRELFRVLVPGGSAYVTSWAPIDQSPLMLARVAAQRAADPSSTPPHQNLMTIEDPTRFQREMQEAGFIDVNVEPIFRESVFKNIEALCAGLTRGSAPFELLKHKVGEEEWNRQLGVMREQIARSYKSFPVRLGSTALLGSGRKPFA